MYQEFNTFTLGFIEEQTINQLKTPDGNGIQVKFIGNEIQHVDLGEIYTEF